MDRSSALTMLERIAVTFVAAILLASPLSAAERSRITGHVIDGETRQPIAGASIEIASSSGGTGFYRAHSDPSGTFTIEGIAADRYYNLAVSAEGYADFVLGGWRFPAQQRASDLQIPLDRAGTIEVRVTAADGTAPIAAARVAVRSETPSPWWEESYRQPPAAVFTDRNGVARFEGLKAGYWTAVAESPGLLTNETRRIGVKRGERTIVPIKLARPASISGLARLVDGSGVAGITVLARGPAEGVGTTDESGQYTIHDLPPGKYRLEIQHDGFEPARGKEPITLGEGEQKTAPPLTATPRPAELSFALTQEVFAPDAKIEIPMRSLRLGEVRLTLWRMPVAALLDSARDFRRYAESTDTTGLTRLRTFSHRTREGAPFTWREEQLSLGDELEGGIYLLAARGGDLERRVLFFVSDLGLLVKRAPGEILIQAASLKTSLAIEGASVTAIPSPSSTRIQQGGEWASALASARRRGIATDVDGLASIPLSGPAPRMRIVAVSERHGVAIAETQLASAAEQRGDQIFLYTERPIYRPGQTVYWKAFARNARGKGYEIPSGSITLDMNGPEGASIPVEARTLSAHGSADGSFDVPSDVTLGEWTLNAHSGRANASASVAIQQYRKPEFRVDVTPDREVYVNGDEVRFNVAAVYFFGAPVFGANVRFNLFESRLQPEESDWETGDEETSAAPAGFGRVLKTGEAHTDADGRVSLTFTPDRVSYDRRLTLEAEVVDPSKRTVQGRGSAIMGRGLFTVSVRAASRLVMVGQAVPIEVRTLDHLGKPVSAAVVVELDQEAWNPIERRYGRSTRPLASASVTTDVNGRATLTLAPTPARSGDLIVRARAEDAKGNRITDESTLWVYDPNVWDYAYRYPTLEAFADREKYQPGDSARVVINTEVGYAAVLATVEGRSIEDKRVVHLFGNTGLVTFPMRADYAPNVYVSISVRKGKEVLTRTLDLAVAAERHDLKIALSPDRESYRPGDQVRVAIATSDSAGHPLRAEVSLGVVDESIYSLRPDRTPDPHEIFYGHRPNWVTTAVSFPLIYYGGADKGGREEIRRDFRDLAFWAPAISTDEQGRGEATFRFPDNLTTWRLTSRGATDDTRVGRAIAKTLVTKDVVARLATPRAFIAGDRAALVSVVTNRAATPLIGVEESIETKGMVKSTGPKSTRSDIPPHGESRHEWSVEASSDLSSAPGDTAEARFIFRARSSTDSDALELVTPVWPRAVPLAIRGGGLAEAASTPVPVALPPDLVTIGSAMRIDLSPSPAGMLLTAADALAEYPWGCTEQSANVIRSAAAVVTALKGTGVAPRGWADPAKRLAPTIARLVHLQNSEGGWGWWENGETDPYLSVLALDALARAIAAELAGDEAGNAIQRAIYQIPRWLYEVRSEDGEAYCLAHLASLLSLSDSKNRYPDLRGQLEDLSLSVRAARRRLGWAGLTLASRGEASLGHAADADTLLGLAMKRAIDDEAGLRLPSDPENEWFGESDENTAYALSALMVVAPSDPRAARMVRWLARQRSGRFWHSTRVTGPVTIALADYLAKNRSEVTPSYRLKVEWNGEALLDRSIGVEDVTGGRDLSIRIPGRRMRSGDNRLMLGKQGTGALYYAWEARAMAPSPGPPVIKSPLEVTREYLHVERTADRRGRPRYLSTSLAQGEALHVGEQVMVRLTLKASRALSFLMIEDPRVTGCEVDALLPDGADRPWDTHAEERDDRVAFFLRTLDQGETVIEYLIRPEIAGHYTALPVSAAGMYEPEIQSRSGEQALEVTAK